MAPHVHLRLAQGDGTRVIRPSDNLAHQYVELGAHRELADALNLLFTLFVSGILLIFICCILILLFFGCCLLRFIQQVLSPLLDFSLVNQNCAVLVIAGNIIDLNSFELSHDHRLLDVLGRFVDAVILEISPKIHSTCVRQAQRKVVPTYNLLESFLRVADQGGRVLVLLITDS